jgi:EmrB/QacA subfamily drug resistance transporter
MIESGPAVAPADPVAPSAPELPRPRRIGVLVICCMSLFIVGLDNTIVNVALPTIRRDLHASVSGLQWTIDAYTLVLASLVMLGGSIGDRTGRRRTFQTGLVLFTTGSLLCGLAPNLDALIAFRAVQAIGGSMLNPVAMSIITNTFTDARERARAIGMWAAVIGLSMALGPIVGGALVDSVGWRWVFFINIPIGLAACGLAGRYVPESKASHARRFDPVGQLILIALFASLTFAIIEGAPWGWTSVGTLAVFAVAAAALAALVLYEPRRHEPLIDLRFFSSAPFSSAVVTAICAFASLAGFLFLNTLYLQDVRGLTPLAAGIDTLPMALVTVVGAPLAGRVVATRGGRIPLVIGGLAIALSALLLTRLTATTPFSELFVIYFIFGLGFGVVNPPITNAAVSGMPRDQAGVAAGTASSSRQVGAALGVAVVGALATQASSGRHHLSFALATHAGWWVITGCGVVIAALGLLTTTPWARATAERTRQLFVPGGAAP